jgi:hypothetical protein
VVVLVVVVLMLVGWHLGRVGDGGGRMMGRGLGGGGLGRSPSGALVVVGFSFGGFARAVKGCGLQWWV